MGRRVERALTGDERQEVLRQIREAETPGQVVMATIIGPYRPLMADVGETWETSEVVDPTDWAVSRDDALAILEAGSARLVEITGKAEASLHLSLEWMNRGVGQFEPERVSGG